MLKLGILGGMGPIPTYECFKQIVDNTAAQRDQEHLDIIVSNHATLPDRTNAIISGNTENLTKMLCSDAVFLQDSGADVIALPCNTAHYFIDHITNAVHIKVINMIRETAAELSRLNRKKVAILGTEGTIKGGVYHRELQKVGIEPFILDDDKQARLTSILYDQIKKGQMSLVDDFLIIDAYIKNAGCDCAILACTELSAYKEFHKDIVDDFYTDAMKVLVKKAITICGGHLKNN